MRDLCQRNDLVSDRTQEQVLTGLEAALSHETKHWHPSQNPGPKLARGFDHRAFHRRFARLLFNRSSTTPRAAFSRIALPPVDAASSDSMSGDATLEIPE